MGVRHRSRGTSPGLRTGCTSPGRKHGVPGVQHEEDSPLARRARTPSPGPRTEWTSPGRKHGVPGVYREEDAPLARRARTQTRRPYEPRAQARSPRRASRRRLSRGGLVLRARDPEQGVRAPGASTASWGCTKRTLRLRGGLVLRLRTDAGCLLPHRLGDAGCSWWCCSRRCCLPGWRWAGARRPEPSATSRCGGRLMTLRLTWRSMRRRAGRGWRTI